MSRTFTPVAPLRSETMNRQLAEKGFQFAASLEASVATHFNADHSLSFRSCFKPPVPPHSPSGAVYVRNDEPAVVLAEHGSSRSDTTQNRNATSTSKRQAMSSSRSRQNGEIAQSFRESSHSSRSGTGLVAEAFSTPSNFSLLKNSSPKYFA